MSLQVRRAASPLRTEFFKTLERDETRSIGISFTATLPDPRIDAAAMDYFHAQRHAFGINYHYLVLLDGRIDIGRDPRTRSTRTRNYFAIHESLQVGVVGGYSPDGERVQTTTPAQARAVEELLQALADALNAPLEVHDGRENWAREAYRTDDEIAEEEDAMFAAREASEAKYLADTA